MRKLIFLPALALGFACTDTATEPNPMEVEPLFAKPVPVDPLETSSCVPHSISPDGTVHTFACLTSGDHTYELTFMNGGNPVTRGTVLGYSCSKDGVTYASEECYWGNAKWERGPKVPLDQNGKALFTITAPPIDVLHGYRWEYKAQGSGIKNHPGWKIDFWGPDGP